MFGVRGGLSPSGTGSHRVGVYGMSRLYFLFLDFLWFVAFPLLFSSLFLYPLINIFYVLTTDN